MTPPSVLVVGGGIGGLCLAHGLRTAGVDVEVAERDTHPAGRWEGYRIHIDPAGARSLQACLPEHLWRAFLDTAGPGGDFGFLTERLDELVVVEEAISYPLATDPAEDHYAVDRRVLRRILLAGLGDAVHLGAEFVGYRYETGGRVTAEFADGRRITADVLVGADGVGSRVRRQYLPDAEPQPVGVVGFGHKVLLTEDSRAWVPQRLQAGMNVISGRDPVSLFTSAYHPRPGARAALAAVTDDVPAGIGTPYVLAALVADAGRLPADVTSLDDRALHRVVGGLVEGWHPDLRRLLAESEPAGRGAQRFVASPLPAPWPSSRVTLLGDAVHVMPPTGGLGGNSALRDAHRLTLALAAVAQGREDLVPAVADYEADLRAHGYAAVRGALSVRDRLIAHGTLPTLATRSWFR
ncbi:MAG: FAD-dependent monooxygenase, partial [Pseudonocardia sp.]|nr:FAD-dependent monooxygenase [Pseudonocardia sp.]